MPHYTRPKVSIGVLELLAAHFGKGRSYETCFLTKGRRWVRSEGAATLSEGKYATSIPLAYAMDSDNDVILAYEMNNMRLPPDHSYPVRLTIPGFVGGRCVKWLHKVYISDKENDSHYHIWDNQVLPSFIRDMDLDFSRTMFSHPSTACNEQNLNSIIVKPGQGARICLSDVVKNKSCRITGPGRFPNLDGRSMF
ncbi:hypothetical protein N7447_000255 [Penicillium robsamsonii]|uniref:uncharacterized protein n=1 Tax=Penicillium robsamsonii TaxID=1792511 RepID=UPI002546EF44|nr:uncharacterized protein N7447_000255 [Penicillium robsamsonii]KAJ5834229.1 hypothetical protein N7447_000255 [Penicillium robsamsonii]